MKILIVGLGKSGISAANYFHTLGYEIYCYDKNLEQLSIEKWLLSSEFKPQFIDENKSLDLAIFEFILISPGIAKTQWIYKKALEENRKIITEASYALSILNQRKIAITGSNGKTTATLFIAHLLNQANLKGKAIGNVGIPFCDYLVNQDPQDVLVCELSSYQLETLEIRTFDMGVILQITPDHMDRYSSFKEYAFAKFNLIKCIKEGGLCYISSPTYDEFYQDLKSFGNLIKKIPEEFNSFNQNCYLQLTKNHEYCDFLLLLQEKALGFELLYLAKQIAASFNIGDEIVKEAISTFKKPEHRLEFVDKIQEIVFVNDSKATNVESVLYAIQMLGKNIQLIVGGRDKNLCFDPWADHFPSRVEKVFAIGECAEKIKSSLDGALEVEICKNLEDAVEKAFLYAKPKSTVLLSPGCASFDSFKDYKHRGESFKQIVTALNKRYSG